MPTRRTVLTALSLAAAGGVPVGDAVAQTTSQQTSSGEWSQQAKLIPDDGDSRDLFGSEVTLEGDTAIISAEYDDDFAGSAYVFGRTDGQWTQQAKLTPDDGDSGDRFGSGVGFDGEIAVIGARSDEGPNGEFAAGSAYVFERTDGGWTQQAKLTPDDGYAENRFGGAVALDGDTAVITTYGIELAYVFERTVGGWTQQAKLTPDDGDSEDAFGGAVALDGDTAVIGADGDEDPNGEDAGSAYVFVRTDGTWSQQTKLTPDDGDSEDEFGSEVALDTDTAIIGAFEDEDPNGEDAGSAYVFERTDGTWTQQAKLTPDDGDSEDRFGDAVTLDSDTAVIGAVTDEDPNGEDAGSAYVFERTDGTWTQQAKLTPDDGISGIEFGNEVTVDSDTAIISALSGGNFDIGAVGSAYVFSRSDAPGDPDARFTPSEHGFGFENYENPDLPGLGEVRSVIEGSLLADIRDLDVDTRTPGFKTALALVVYTGLEGGLTDGHCLGMVFAARDYYNNGLPDLENYTPSEVPGSFPGTIQTPPQTAVDIVDNPEDTSTLDPVETDIDQQQQTQVFDSTHILRYLGAIAAPEDGAGSLNNTALLTAIKQRTDANETAPVSLADTIQTGHVVLAHDLTVSIPTEETAIENARVVDVSVYDPNDRFRSRTLTFSRSTTADEFDMAEYASGVTYDRAIFIEEVDPDYQFFTDEGTTDGLAAAVSKGMGNYLTVGVLSPVTLDVTGPDGTPLRQVDVDPEVLQAETGYEELYFGLDLPAGDYDITVTGTGNGEYTIETKGATVDGGKIDDSYTGEITTDETQTLNATLPDDPEDDGTIDPGFSVAEYDRDNNGQIGFTDLLFALEDYNNEEITFVQLLRVLQAYNTEETI